MLADTGQEFLADAINGDIGLFRQDIFNLIQIGFDNHVLIVIPLEIGKEVLQRLR